MRTSSNTSVINWFFPHSKDGSTSPEPLESSPENVTMPSNSQVSARTAALLMKCPPDRKGLFRSIADFFSSNSGDIPHADHHIDLETHYTRDLAAEIAGAEVLVSAVGNAGLIRASGFDAARSSWT
jgi:hypothetical protein